jgi:hypothetical protein
MNHLQESTTAAGVVLPMYLEYLDVARTELAPQRFAGFAASSAEQKITERKPRTA